jgi:hypothetical protein
MTLPCTLIALLLLPLTFMACGGRSSLVLPKAGADSIGSGGGMTSAGGWSSVGTGGAGSGGRGGSGGITGSGGSLASGGRGGSGGVTGSGGSMASGGRSGSGGVTGSGGTKVTCNGSIFQEGGLPGTQVRDYPNKAAVGDWNGDGKLDLATMNTYTNTVSVLLGKGDGTFSSRMDYDTGQAPSSIATGDLNGDGKPDLVTSNGEGSSVSVLLGKGDGSFAFKIDYPTADEPWSVVIGDWSGDGKMDLIASNSLLLGKGDGTFAPKVDYTNVDYAGSMAAGDLNRDGSLDLVMQTIDNQNNGNIAVLLGKGDGSFAGKSAYAPFGFIVSMALGDLNADGKLDLAMIDNCGPRAATFQLRAFVGMGDGTFASITKYESHCSDMIAMGDINNDGKLDIVTGA